MTEEKHAQRHKELHAALDELMNDWRIRTHRFSSQTSLMEFCLWSAAQASKPDHEQEGLVLKEVIDLYPRMLGLLKAAVEQLEHNHPIWHVIELHSQCVACQIQVLLKQAEGE